jgi:subtilisin
MTTSSIRVAEQEHPSHIVIFKQPAEDNERALTSVAKLKPRKGVQSSSGILAFANAAGSRAHSRLFRSLAVAAVSMDDNMAAKLQGHRAVETIVRNRIRSIPRPQRRGTSLESALGQPGTEPAALYLRGLRDAASLALAFMGGAGAPGTVAALDAPMGFGMAALGSSWPLALIGITPNYRYTGRGVSVAVLDTGIDLGHPDFSGRLQDGVNARYFIQGLSTAQDGLGHGTHCAGIIAGPLNPASGERFGVAPDVALMVGKVLDDDGFGSDDDIIEGIQWAADNGAKVISLSLGSARGPGEDFSQLYETLASRLLNEGVLLVAATGNESSRPHYTRPVGNPAACPSIMGVGAVDRRMAIARFSDCRMDDIGEVDLVAPGVAIRSSWAGGGYWLDSGTSMACPHVAGVAALHLERDPGLTAVQLRKALVDGAKTLGRAEDFGHGLVQAP